MLVFYWSINNLRLYLHAFVTGGFSATCSFSVDIYMSVILSCIMILLIYEWILCFIRKRYAYSILVCTDIAGLSLIITHLHNSCVYQKPVDHTAISIYIFNAFINRLLAMILKLDIQNELITEIQQLLSSFIPYFYKRQLFYKHVKWDKQAEYDCAICFEEFKVDTEVAKLKCNHYYHITCIDSLFKFKLLCPLCNTYIELYN